MESESFILAGTALVHLERSAAYERELTLPKSAHPRTEVQEKRIELMRTEVVHAEKALLTLIMKYRPELNMRVNEIARIGFFIGGDIDIDALNLAPGEVEPANTKGISAKSLKHAGQGNEQKPANQG